jgi:hypothetical protein
LRNHSANAEIDSSSKRTQGQSLLCPFFLTCSHAPAWEYIAVFQISECFIVLTTLRLITLPAKGMNAFKTSIQLPSVIVIMAIGVIIITH